MWIDNQEWLLVKSLKSMNVSQSKKANKLPKVKYVEKNGNDSRRDSYYLQPHSGKWGPSCPGLDNWASESFSNQWLSLSMAELATRDWAEMHE